MTPTLLRRSFLSTGAVTLTRPVFAMGEEEVRDCNEAVYLILRVQEATQQEKRLVKSGKFRDLQRANVKYAIQLMLKNYAFADAVNSASALVPQSKLIEATQTGRDAIEALQNVLEYFDASSRSLNVETISGEKLDFVIRALEAASTRVDAFLTYLPPDEVTKAKVVVSNENQKNLAEYQKATEGESYLNPPPKA